MARRKRKLIGHPREGKGKGDMIKGEGHLCEFARAAVTQSKGNWLSHSSGTQKSKTKVSAGSPRSSHQVSPAASLLTL